MRPSSATPAAEDGSPQMFKHPVFAREVTTWMQRAEPDDRERFERVFATADADATADLGATATRLTLAQSQPFSLIAMPPGAASGSPRVDKAPQGKPPKPQQHGAWEWPSMQACHVWGVCGAKVSSMVSLGTKTCTRVPTNVPTYLTGPSSVPGWV